MSYPVSNTKGLSPAFVHDSGPGALPQVGFLHRGCPYFAPRVSSFFLLFFFPFAPVSLSPLPLERRRCNRNRAGCRQHHQWGEATAAVPLVEGGRLYMPLEGGR